MKGVIGVCRIGVDDIHLLRAWVGHHRGNYCERVGVVLFVRPGDDEVKLLTRCEEMAVDDVEVVRGVEFENMRTLAGVNRIARSAQLSVLLHCDSDEFVVGGADAYAHDVRTARQGAGVSVVMVDRVAGYKELYDVHGCQSYDDLCGVAPRRSMITRDVQRAAYRKCYLQPGMGLGGLHKSKRYREELGACALDHFKWRTEYLAKARRRYREVLNQGLKWHGEIERMLRYFEG